MDRRKITDRALMRALRSDLPNGAHRGARSCRRLGSWESPAPALQSVDFGVEDLPFGGVGQSGIGAYHGPEGFETFSHKKAVLAQSRFNAAGLIAPPYGPKIERLLKLLGG